MTGHQWYWSYEVGIREISRKKFDSYIIPTPDLSHGAPRLLEVDNRLILPIKTDIRILVTSADVLHSWAIPSLGLKVDAVPGRLNQTPLNLPQSGIYYGQCSELCGSNHRFMPIAIESIDPKSWITWLSTPTAIIYNVETEKLDLSNQAKLNLLKDCDFLILLQKLFTLLVSWFKYIINTIWSPRK